MLQMGDGLGFDAETGQRLRAGEAAGEDHFEGAKAIEARLPRLVDHPHAAPAQLAEDLVAGHLGRQPGLSSVLARVSFGVDGNRLPADRWLRFARLLVW